MKSQFLCTLSIPLLFLYHLKAQATCSCNEFNKEECNALPSKRCQFDEATSKCIQTNCTTLDQSTCTKFPNCYWGGETPKCKIKLAKCSDYATPKDCTDSGCWFDKEIAITKFVCETPKICSDFINVDSCPTTTSSGMQCFKKGTLCLQQICENYDQQQCANECSNKYKFTDNKCVKKDCSELKLDNCNGSIQNDGNYCQLLNVTESEADPSLQDSCIALSLKTPCKDITQQNACIKYNCLFDGTTCKDKICANYPQVQCKLPFFFLKETSLSVCKPGDSNNCVNGTLTDISKDNCLQQQESFHLLNDTCTMCSDLARLTTQKPTISNTNIIASNQIRKPLCTCQDYGEEECKLVNQASGGCIWDTFCQNIQCDTLEIDACGKIWQCYWGGEKTKCKNIPDSCPDYVFDQITEELCNKNYDKKSNKCGFDSENSKCTEISVKGCLDFSDKDSCPETCYWNKEFCVEKICENMQSKLECESAQCSTLYKWSDTNCLKKECSDIEVEKCEGTLLQEQICYLEEQTCKSIAVESTCQEFKTEKSCSLGALGCKFQEGTCVDKTCEDLEVSRCETTSPFVLGGNYKFCSKNETICSEVKVTEQSCTVKYNYDYAWNDDSCILCGSNLPSVKKSNNSERLFLILFLMAIGMN